jgi:hypothetical protein
MRPNPIAARLSRLSDQWASFRENESARLLCWQFTAAEQSCFDAFIELESDERTAEHATLFVTLDAPFDGADAYGRRLTQALSDGMEQGEEELGKLGLPSGWKVPVPGKQERDAAYWVRVCESFLRFFEVGVELGVILRPKAISDVAGCAQWLVELARVAPKKVRTIVLEDADEVCLAPLLAAPDGRFVCTRAALDVPGALIALSDAAGNLDTPGGKFRDLFLRMGQALQQRDLARAVAYGDAAISVALEHSLFHLAVPVNVALAASLLAGQREADGLGRYAAAESHAQRGAEQEDEALASLCRTLQLQAVMAHGAGLAGLKRWRDAAGLFERAQPMAAVAQDAAATLDCQRLSSFCHEQDGNAPRAWQGVRLALQHAQKLDASQRQQLDFDALGQLVQRLAAARPVDEANPVLQQLAQLLRKERSKDEVAAAVSGVA